MILVSDIVNFILRHRGKGKAFNYGETSSELQAIICNSIVDECCVVDCDWLGSIKGIVVGELQPEYKRIHIMGIITINRGSTAKFAKWLLERHNREGWNLTALRKGKFVEYNTPKLLNKLLNKS